MSPKKLCFLSKIWQKNPILTEKSSKKRRVQLIPLIVKKNCVKNV